MYPPEIVMMNPITNSMSPPEVPPGTHRVGIPLDDEGLRLLVRGQLLVLAYVEERVGPRVFVGLEDIRGYDPIAPRREAAMFYGLFLRGHSAEDLRKDIDIPKETLAKWQLHYRAEGFREALERVYQYRKQVLAIFDELVTNERNRHRLQ